MLKNYLNIGLRNLKKNKVHSVINILGLIIGLACFILIFLYVIDELSYDKFHEKADQIYRLAFKEDRGYKTVNFPITPGGVASALIKEFPEVINAVRFCRSRDYVVKVGNESFDEQRFFYADASLFDVFSLTLIKGNPKTVLLEPNSIILTEETAQKYFGDKNPLGKVLIIGNNTAYKVTGIFDKIPHNSHFHFDILASISTFKNISDEWFSSSCYTYLLVRKDTDYIELERKLPDFWLKYRTRKIDRHFYLQSLTDIHLHSNLEREIEPNSSIAYVYILSAIAIFVLLIACINFINLYTARSANRAKEVGMRKVAGAHRGDLIKQFLSESVFLTLFAFVSALVLVELFLPMFNKITSKHLSILYVLNFWTVLGLAGLVIIVGFLSGIYPAFYISSFQPVKILKGTLALGSKGSGFRRILVVVQFCLSIVMIIGTMVIRNQLEFIKSEKLGFNKEHVVVLKVSPYDIEIQKKYYSIKNELLQNPNVLYVTASTNVPGQVINPEAFVPEGISDDNWIFLGYMIVDYDFIKTLGLEIKEGRDFFKDLKTDLTGAFILNEAAVKKLGWESPIGKKLGFPKSSKREVVGIVKDFHYQSKHRMINPLVLSLISNDYLIWNISVKIKPGNIQETLGFIKSKWKEFSPGRPLTYSFLDENYDKLYKEEEKLSEIFGYFALLAIFVACLGLYGLASFSTELRTKEIGIRKVLGASVGKIVLLLSKEFTKWVLFANIIAWPIGYYAMNRWLGNFAYRIGINFWIFFLGAALALAIALLTVSFQAVRAALANPIDSLRFE